MAISTRILLVSGSTRSGSTNTAMLRTAQTVAPDDDQATSSPVDGVISDQNVRGQPADVWSAILGCLETGPAAS